MCAPLLEHSIAVHAQESSGTTTFELTYTDENLETRNQFLKAAADPFEVKDIEKIQAHIFHLGPLTTADMSPDFIEAVAARGLVGLDVQGFVRIVHDGRVQLGDWPDKDRVLPLVDYLKADLTEAGVLTGETDMTRAARALLRMGAREVLITDGQKGSLVAAEGVSAHIPAFSPTCLVDATGCGDTYIAAYLVHRLHDDNLEAAGLFAAAAASLKISEHGPLKKSRTDVEKLAAQMEQK